MTSTCTRSKFDKDEGEKNSICKKIQQVMFHSKATQLQLCTQCQVSAHFSQLIYHMLF